MLGTYSSHLMGLGKFVGPTLYQDPVTYLYVSQMNPVHAFHTFPHVIQNMS